MKTACDCPADCGHCILTQPATITTRYCLSTLPGTPLGDVCRMERGHEGEHRSLTGTTWGDA
jgi:hypothetical protein